MMKKTYYTLLFLLTIITLYSCEDQNGIDPDFNFITFDDTPNITVSQNSTFEQKTVVYSSRSTDSDRVINISINLDETTADPNSYNVPNTITIPANSNKGEFIIKISDTNIDASGESLTIEFDTSDGLFTGDALSLSIYKSCELDINLFLGDYTITEVDYGAYGSAITLDPVVSNRIWVSNFWNWAVGLAYYDFNPEDGTITMPSQDILMGDGNIYSSNGSGTYNACDGSFHMEYQGDVGGTIHDFTPKP